MRYCLLYFCSLCMLFPSTELSAQLPVFNSNFVRSKHIKSKGELADSLKIMSIVDRAYEIQGAKVVEYYERNTARFLGFAGDTTQFDLRKLPYLCRTAMMRRLVREFGPEHAHDIRNGAFHRGMLRKDVLEIHGWPDRRSKENGKKIWTYDDFVLTFDGQDLVDVVRSKQGS